MAESTEMCQILKWWWIQKQQAASQEELRSVSDNINLIYTNLSAIICDPAWQNRAYVHIRFYHFLDFEVL